MPTSTSNNKQPGKNWTGYRYRIRSLICQEHTETIAIPWIEKMNPENVDEQSFKTQTIFWLIEQDNQPKCTRIDSTTSKSRTQANVTNLNVWDFQKKIYVY